MRENYELWMKKGDGEPEQVDADTAAITRKMVAGYRQCEPPVRRVMTGELNPLDPEGTEE